MDPDACFQLGYISGTHGLRGEVHVVLDADNPKSYYKMESVLLSPPGSGQLIPFFIEYLKPQGSKMVVKFEEASSLDEAKALLGSSLHLPLDQLPELTGGAFYYHEILGYQVIDSSLGPLGVVSAIYDQTPQVLIAMQYQNREVLIPFTDKIVLAHNRKQQQLQVSLPAGLLEIYMEDHLPGHED